MGTAIISRGVELGGRDFDHSMPSNAEINPLKGELNPICHLLALLRKGKAVPLQAWSGPEGSRKLKFHDNSTGWW